MGAPAVTFLATTTATLFRTPPGSVDALLDPVDVDVQVGTDPIPLALTEKGRRVFFQESEEWRTVRYMAARCSPSSGILKGDRLLDLSTGKKYVVDEANVPTRGLAGHATMTLELRLLGGS